MVRPLFDTNILIDYLNAIPAAAEELDRYESAGDQHHHLDGGVGGCRT